MESVLYKYDCNGGVVQMGIRHGHKQAQSLMMSSHAWLSAMHRSAWCGLPTNENIKRRRGWMDPHVYMATM